MTEDGRRRRRSAKEAGDSGEEHVACLFVCVYNKKTGFVDLVFLATEDRLVPGQDED